MDVTTKIIEERARHLDFIAGNDPIAYGWVSRHFHVGALAALRAVRDATTGKARKLVEEAIDQLHAIGSPNHPSVTTEEVLTPRRKPRPPTSSEPPTAA